MRVTHVITRLVVGGAQENTVATVLGLRSKPGIDVHLISGPQTGPEGSLQASFEQSPDLLTIVPNLVRPVDPWRDTLALLHLIRIFRRQPPDIVHTHSGKAGILGRIAACRARVPIIIHHIHGPSFGPFQNNFANWAFMTAERYAATMTTHFVCSANAMSRIYLAAGIGHPDMYTRVFSGFRVDSFLKATHDPTLRTKLGLAQDAFVIGKVARLSPLKGHEDLFQAAQILLRDYPQAKLLFVGDGPLRMQIEKRAVTLGLRDKVVFTGLVTPDDVPRFIGIMDCLVHLSTREGLPRALPQAMAAGKPVISYDLYGANEVCFDHETGFLVREGDIAAVSRQLLELARDRPLRDKLGRKGQELVQEQFRVEHMVEAFHEVYLRLANKAGLSTGIVMPARGA